MLRSTVCLSAFLVVLIGFPQKVHAQCASDPISPSLFQFDIDKLFEGLDRSLAGQFPEWLERYDNLNTTDPSPFFRNEDNSQNGINDDDHIELLGAILSGLPAGTVLSGIASTQVTNIRNSFASNRSKVRPDLTLNILFVTVNIIDEINADDPEFGASLQDLVAAYMTVGDAASVAYIRNLLITLGEIFIEQGVAAGDIPGFVEGLVKDTLRSTVNANFVAARYESYGNAPGATKPNLLGATGNIGGTGSTNLAEYTNQGRNRQAWLIAKGVALPPVEISPVPVDITVTAGEDAIFETGLLGGDGSFAFRDWKKINESTGATSRVSTELSLRFPYALPSDSGLYFLIVCDNTWVRSTEAIRLTVNSAPYAIVEQPEAQSVVVGNSTTLSVVVRGGASVPTYQWFKGSTPGNLIAINGANSPTLALNNLQLGDDAVYQVRVTNNTTTLNSDIVAVDVTEAPDLTPPVLSLLGANPLQVECGGTFSEPGFTAVDNRDGDLFNAVAVTGAVNSNVAGTYELSYAVSDAAGNEASTTRVVQVLDRIPPTLNLLGSQSLLLACGTPFNEPGFSATDSCSGDLSGAVEITGAVNTAVPGTYLLTYEVSDGAGNETSASREVIVQDLTAPVLTLSGSLDIVLACGDTFSEPGFTATDSCAGNLDDDVIVTGMVESNVPGDYVLTYSVSDPSGNQAQASRQIEVRDLTAPSLTLNGSAETTLECGATYSEPGATASDACDGDLSEAIAILGTVDTDTPGNYEVSYTVSDAAGNESVATRTVFVQDTQAPALTLNGSDTLTIECGGDFTDPGATATDGCEGTVTDRIETTGVVDTTQPGTYVLQYEVSDNAGNEATIERTVQVTDTIAPDLSLAGEDSLTLACGDAFVEPGFTASDTCDANLDDAVEMLGAVDTTTPGEYLLEYRVSDAAGNTTTASRTITVVDSTAPLLSLNGSATMTLECGATFTDPGATATDDCDGDLSSGITVDGSVDRQTPGLYTLTYRVADASGNESTLNRVVEVVDNTAPVLTLVGGEAISIPCGSTFNDPGASANDACDGLVSASIRLSGSVDTDLPGTYEIAYTARDDANNIATRTRTVTVVDDVPPVVTLNGPETVSIGCGASFVDSGATAVDDCDGTLAVEVVGNVDVQSTGTYELRYEAMDSGGNLAVATRLVTVENNCEITISSQPEDLDLYAGSEARFQVTARSGARPLEYQWLKEGIAIPEAINATLILTDITLDDAGSYACIVSDGEDSTSTRTVVLQVFERLASGQHSVDSNLDWAISLSELLRLIQFFNSGRLGCAIGTEDGYSPTSEDESCLPHASDYNPQNWRISLSELLRAIQFFNVPGGQYSVSEGTEDGFAPGAG